VARRSETGHVEKGSRCDICPTGSSVVTGYVIHCPGPVRRPLRPRSVYRRIAATPSAPAWPIPRSKDIRKDSGNPKER